MFIWFILALAISSILIISICAILEASKTCDLENEDYNDTED